MIIATLIGLWIANKDTKTQKSIHKSKLKTKINELEISLNLNEKQQIIKNLYEKIKTIKENNSIFIKHNESLLKNDLKNEIINSAIDETIIMLEKIDSKNKKLIK